MNSEGRPYFDRSWTECFAQLVGTVLSLWDAAALDKAESDGEVPATFINLGDASIKMVEINSVVERSELTLYRLKPWRLDRKTQVPYRMSSVFRPQEKIVTCSTSALSTP